ncbi:RNA-binding protein PIN4 [Candida viswanathii]|uniref:RNA-binding protein PIN4 n=1 Tax=Candida viswanathii TaxID=5486 RepID=A0A367YMG0_9ASCO|nr:RNA-binding protein PIN4 [Candida viswanathii]
MDTVMQRRPSLSSLSSASGYSSSTYGGPNPNSNSNTNTHANNTPKLSNQRLTTTRNLQSSWVNQSNTTPSNVGPWIEQQQQQTLDLLATNKDNADVNPTTNPTSTTSTTTATSSTPNTGNISISSSTSINDANDNAETINNVTNNNNNNPVNANINDGNVTASPNTTATSTNANTSTINEADDDELIPTAIVIKNIPFAIKKEQLLDVMTKLNLPLPYAFNYHFDNGVFRGLAFANFTSTDETSLVVNQLNGREIGGRKLRVEYKKMLPLQERERIEREKREKRGQLEEQHRSASNASLASLLSAASTTAATKNLSVAGTTTAHTTERLFLNLPFNNALFNIPPMEINFNDPEVLELYTQLILYRDDITKSIFELAISPANLSISQRKIISIICNYLNLLELFDNGLVIIRRKPGHIAPSITQQPNIPIQQQSQQLQQQQQQQQAQQQQANLLQQQSQNASLQASHSNSMMNLNQLGGLTVPTHPELLRSQSQSALQLPRLRQQTSTPTQQQQQQQQQQQTPQQQQQQQSQPQQPQQYSLFNQQALAGQQQPSRPYLQAFNLYHPGSTQLQPPSASSGTQGFVTQSQIATPTLSSTSAAALLRSSSNRSYVDVRSTPPLNNNFIQHQQQQQQQQQGQTSSIHDSPTPHHLQAHGQQQYFSSATGGFNSQPQTPLTANSDVNSRFQPFGQHAHLTSSFTSLSQTLPSAGSGTVGGGVDEYSSGNVSANLSSKLNSLGLGGNTNSSTNGGFEGGSSGSGIWGPK